MDSLLNSFISTHLCLLNFFNPNLTDQGYMEQIGSLPLIHDASFYLMKMSYGTPPIEFYHIIDTGSDISWIQCLPCSPCHETESAPFNPNSSSTFKFENCTDKPNQRCPYEIEYEDDSHSYGYLARETITIGSNSQKKEFKDFLSGCGNNNTGYFPYKGASIIGLNREKQSFITQLRTEHHGLFSYCMAPPESAHAGKISFGQEAKILGNNVMTTPIVHDFDYAIMLTKITVKRHKLKNFPDSYLSSNGSKEKNFQIPLIVDSGSKATYLPNSLYSDVEQNIKKNIKKPPIRGMGDFRLCYSSSLRDADIPEIKLHFRGLILKLNPANTFIQVDNGRRCLAIFPTDESFVLGHLPQINYLVGFDLVKNKVSFKPTNCATL